MLMEAAMDTHPERFLTRIEIPAIFLIATVLFGAAFAHDHDLWRVTTTILFATAGVALFVAFYVAAKHRWS